jgi:hypothetical protein
MTAANQDLWRLTRNGLRSYWPLGYSVVGSNAEFVIPLVATDEIEFEKIQP